MTRRRVRVPTDEEQTEGIGPWNVPEPSADNLAAFERDRVERMARLARRPVRDQYIDPTDAELASLPRWPEPSAFVYATQRGASA